MNHYISLNKGLATGLLAGLLAIVSCNKVIGPDDARFLGETGTVEIMLPCAGITTKAVGVTEAMEKTVNGWTAWVFDGIEPTSKALLYGSATGADGRVVKTVPAGKPITIAVLANSPSNGQSAVAAAGVKTLADLRSRTSLLSDNAVGALVMYGEKTLTVDRDQTVSPVVDIVRLASKIVLSGVSINFDNASLSSKPCTLEGVYLTNVLTRSHLSSALAAGELTADGMWYNPMGWHRDGQTDAALDALTGNPSLNRSMSISYSEENVFYAYPNKCSADTHDISAWSPRHTRMVLQVSVGDKVFYYQVTVPVMERNKVYTAAPIIITAPGTVDPEDETPAVIEVNFTVADWETWDTTYNVIENS